MSARQFLSLVTPLLSGFFLAVAVSGGIVGERVSEGNLQVALAANALVTLLSVLVLVFTTRARGVPCMTYVATQGFGALLGIALVHQVLRGSGLAFPWLSEGPAQLVNDLVATFGVLALVFGMARGADLRALAASLLLVTAYRATSGMWHLDHAPHGFLFTVQQLVVAQVAAVALAMVAFRVFSPVREV
ncbi:hypothetical protein AKJ09_01809 [Labilithrix luteola]|uniref:Uncharacterized protein n=1 Tax=Labilithrix luteola TaxID=1391654 RepID=A0A0K1PNM4_9BACT|nr:hypothetical protein [Labilithrix luteola]AKU95145.1 hypothetical protein AKJ09_01809 [Labilithrix luteola]